MNDEYVQGYGRAGCLAGAQGVFSAMLRDPRVCPDTVAINSFLDAAVRNSALPLAMAMLARITQQVSKISLIINHIGTREYNIASSISPRTVHTAQSVAFIFQVACSQPLPRRSSRSQSAISRVCGFESRALNGSLLCHCCDATVLTLSCVDNLLVIARNR